MDFWEATPHEIHHMTKAIENEERRSWARTAQICALFANAHRAKGKRPFKPEDFYPFKVERPSVEDLTREEIDTIRKNLESRGK